MNCVEPVDYDITINGCITESWKPQRGIRQGDPLSSYIFIICMNFLILKFFGMQINNSTPPIPILCFADDCITFCKNNKKSIDFIKNTLSNFAEEAGLSINWNKTKAYFSKKIPLTKN